MNNIKKLMKMRNITQKELADRCNITEAAVSRYAKGNRLPRLDVAQKIAFVLGCSIEDLISSPLSTVYPEEYISRNVLLKELFAHSFETVSDKTERNLVKEIVLNIVRVAPTAFIKENVVKELKTLASDEMDHVWLCDVLDIVENGGR